MKNKFMQTVARIVLGLLILTVGTQVFVFGQENSIDDQKNQRSIQGTWQTMVTPRNCQTGDPVAPAFPGILTFNEGGTLTGTSTALTSVFGVWERQRGWRNYSFAFISLRYSPDGTFLGTQKVRQTAALAQSGSSFTSTGSVEILDVNGNTIGTGCATSTGTRFE